MLSSISFDYTQSLTHETPWLKRPRRCMNSHLDDSLHTRKAVSDSTIFLPSDSEEPLAERAQKLVRVLQTLRNASSDAPCLVTPAWIERASRIYRRVPSDSNETPALSREVVAALKGRANQTAYIQEHFVGAAAT
jgi:hypothetical protein